MKGSEIMVSKRPEYGFLGYDTPVIPRARRSIRKKASSGKKTSHEGQQLCPFELLATVAGKLLQEAEGSSTSSSAAVRPDGTLKDQFIKREVEEPLRIDQDDHGSSEESVVSSGLRLLKCPKRDTDKMIFKNSSPVDSSACSTKMAYSDMKSASNKSDDEFLQIPSKVDRGSPKCGESVGVIVDNEIPTSGDGHHGSDGEVLLAANKCRAKDDTVRFSGKSPTLKVSNNEVNAKFDQLPHGRGASIPDPSFIRYRNDVKIDSSRDDDENFSRCSDPHSSNIKASRSTTPVGDRGLNKMLGSKNWKSVPKLNDCEATNNSSGENDALRNKKFSSMHERFPQHNAPFKKRKLFAQSSVVTQDAGVSSESVSNSAKKVVYDNKSSPILKPHKDNGVSSPALDRQRTSASRNSHVKLSIKSFKVPELLIEVPESTSVGSLKKTVLEAVTTVFGGGLRVGLLFNGKRVRDDSRTLLQAGLSGGGNLDNLGVLLEPSSPTTLPSSNLTPKVSPFNTTDDSPKDFVNRPHITRKEESNLIDLLDKKPVPDSTKSAGSGRQDLIPFSAPLKPDRKPVSDSRSLAVVLEKVEPLAVVPLGQRPRRAEIGQRRTRRPFSVSEVEALVQAVEKLGTGRWRDVKLCAFENAKHRTYVDLKDKWKTLVHTARISPQQRRGEPVPQELLDRVLAAHAYWSQHQAKQHGKQQYQQQHHHHQTSQFHVEKVAA